MLSTYHAYRILLYLTTHRLWVKGTHHADCCQEIAIYIVYFCVTSGCLISFKYS
jgi:hypothetical protein